MNNWEEFCTSSTPGRVQERRSEPELQARTPRVIETPITAFLLREIGRIDNLWDVSALLGEARLDHDVLDALQSGSVGSQCWIAIIVFHLEINIRAEADGLGVEDDLSSLF